MGDSDSNFVSGIVLEVTKGTKYAQICTDLVEWVTRRELKVTHKPKELVRRVRNKLHQVASAYFENRFHTPSGLKKLKFVPRNLSSLQVKEFCRRALGFHSSTSERLDYLDEFYSAVIAKVGEIHSIYDFACGLNPLALPWMRLNPNVEYSGCDVFVDQVAFLNRFLAHERIQGHIETINLASQIPNNKSTLLYFLRRFPALSNWIRPSTPGCSVRSTLLSWSCRSQLQV